MGIEDGRVTVSSLAITKFIVQDIPPIVSSFVTSTVRRGPFSAEAVGGIRNQYRENAMR